MKPIHAKMYEHIFGKENPGLPGNIIDVIRLIHNLIFIETNSCVHSGRRRK
jgi:hypothetical protein